MSTNISRAASLRIMTAAAIALAIFLIPHASSAAIERSMTVALHVVDEFGEPLHKTPFIDVQGCAVERVGITRPREQDAARFDAVLYFTDAQRDQSCSLTVGATGFVTSEPFAIGNLTNGATVSASQKSLAHGLTLTARTNEGVSLPNLDAYFAGESFRYKRGDTYYFAPQRMSGDLMVAHPAYTIKNVPSLTLTASRRTTVDLNGAGTCAQSGGAVTCGGMVPLLALDVDNEAGGAFINGKIELFTDVKRTKLAPLFTSSPQDAQRTIDRSDVYMPILPGSYYLKVSKSGYNDHHQTVTIPAAGAVLDITMGLESSNIVSPRQSKITFNKTQATADGVDTVTINVEARSSDSTTLNGQPVEIVSSRSAADTITYPEGTSTQAGGKLTAYITSQRAGESVITARINGKEISTFNSIVFLNANHAAVSPRYSSVVSTPSPILADGIEKVSLTLTVRDAQQNVLTATPTTVVSSRAGSDTIACTDAETNGAGQVVCTFSSRIAGTSILTFRANGVIVEEIAISVSPITE